MNSLRQLMFLMIAITAFIVTYSCSDKSSKQNQLRSDSNLVSPSNTTTIDSLLFNKGEAIFNIDCKTCHARKRGLHDYLEGVVERVGVPYLKLYLTKQDSLVSSKDSIALLVKKVWNNLPNSHNFQYNSDELDAIVEYLK